MTVTTLPQYCDENVLLVPDGLFGLADATPLMAHRNSGIFHKLISREMTGIEFFTNMPCLAYVVRGVETFYSADDEEFIIHAGDTLLLPRHHYMISDFHSTDGPLEAFLFCFSDDVIKEFLKIKSAAEVRSGKSSPALFRGSVNLTAYINALPQVYDTFSSSAALVKLKLLELLMLLDHHDTGQLVDFLATQNASHTRRNIRQIMREHAIKNFTVSDFARLSGRSLSTFKRDFKRDFGISPSRWMRNAKLEEARELVLESPTPILEIAQHVGYADASHFIKAFKARYDATPKQLRRSLAE
ncbi:helix-turn-helix domain-containing protein [Cohaesibacter gelatinilyticus]|uniref:AraC-type DNA-binding protein n=1 Tax=Cohaesibacter gelatinilyticus TaxID=372072 RepID=A0A285PD08_9HYPH|nr:AraC family transcriptional regulator [Cohaesibacter gelatinilyticus]SNZ19599.1 AraC-type DNA-binding protein [Cohaesibacter gelatinilyticus]HAT86984.1 AraC family transcriptional regulator [Hyphomicrobiales bacterium]